MQVLLKILLSPFSILYGLITYIRNILFDLNVLRSISFDLPVICVGNINTGGTGKSPIIELLIRILRNNNIMIATLSRGYGRNTRGFVLADENSTAQNLGDEPLQFHHKFPDITVSVCENRVIGIKQLLQIQPPPEVILLDDAFQHRRVKARLNILLTDYSKLYIHDSMLPSGRLREFPMGANRADIIIITKSPQEISDDEKKTIIKRLRIKTHQQVFFSFILYGNWVPFFKNDLSIDDDKIADNILMFSGIANPKPLNDYLITKCNVLHALTFSDHHAYTANDINQILLKFSNFTHGNNLIITTEKDYSRLLYHPQFELLKDKPIYYMPIEMGFSEEDHHRFEQIIFNYARKN